jgi:hypothetical protein
MRRSYHFPFGDLRSDEDMTAGNPVPLRVGEIRSYMPITMDAGDGETISQVGYRSVCLRTFARPPFVARLSVC